jgi:N-acetylmuramoyl-L-alanine amidase
MKLPVIVSASVLLAVTAAFSVSGREAGLAAAVDAQTQVAGTASRTLVTAADAPSPAWQRPSGPPRVALQAGHWKAAEAPDEQARLRTNGTRGGGREEWEVNLEIARRTATLLEDAGISVELLPTTIPPAYWADLFVSVHADGHASAAVSGYRAAAPRRDATGRAAEFAALLERTYGEATGLRHYPSVTRRMVNYYAFNWRRYEHALHPMTVAVILETGFLTSPTDRRVIVGTPERAARGIAEAVVRFVETLALEAPAVTPSVVTAPRE